MAQLERLASAGLIDHPFHRDAGVDDVLCHLSSRLSHIRVSAGVRAPGGQCQQFGGQIIGAWLGFLGQRVTQKKLANLHLGRPAVTGRALLET